MTAEHPRPAAAFRSRSLPKPIAVPIGDAVSDQAVHQIPPTPSLPRTTGDPFEPWTIARYGPSRGVLSSWFILFAWSRERFESNHG